MPVPANIGDLSPNPAANSPTGNETVGPNLDDYLRTGFAFHRQIAVDFAGDTAPTDPVPYMLWADTGNGLLRRRKADNTGWLTEGQLNRVAEFLGPTDPAAYAEPYSAWTNTADGKRYRRSSGGGAWFPIGDAFLDVSNRCAVFTANGTFTVPLGVTLLRVSGCAAGGGGGGGAGYVANFQFHGAGGGAGQPIQKAAYSVTPLTTINIAIGGAGAGGAGGSIGNAGSIGAAGGDTTLSGAITLTLTGGGGGFGGTSGGPAFGGTGFPRGSSAFGGQVASASSFNPSGAGASGPFGGGGGSVAASSFTVPGYGAFGFGAGGGGGAAPSSSVAGGAGGNGAPGIIILEW
ncbi:hypothetical protein GHR37_22245 [Achromobacter xylosoxidans]|nr:hypothetical protein [Achromobacter xylosoxidans]